MEGFAEALGVFGSVGIWILMVGCALWGMLVGALPGVTVTLALILFMPLTFQFPMNTALVGLVVVYVSGVYGGAVPAILLNIPGTGASIMTSVDGYPMTKQGRAGLALGAAATSSWVSLIFTALAMLVLAPWYVNIATQFGAREIFMFALWGFIISCVCIQGSKLKSFAAGFIGLLIGCIGISARYELPRFTWGSSYLQSRVNIVAALIGLYGITEVLNSIISNKELISSIRQRIPKVTGFLQSLKPNYWPLFLFAITIGFIVGVIPGTGAIVATVMSYGIYTRFSKHKKEFGKGRLEGVLLSETANNAIQPGAALTTLVLGIPGNGDMVIFLSAFTLHGLRCGPGLLAEHPEFLCTVFISFIVAAFLVLALAWLTMPMWCKAIQIPKAYLWPAVLLLCISGAYFTNSNMYDVFMMLGIGLLGFFCQRMGFPRLPILMGLVLGPLMEGNLGVALQIYSPLSFFAEPLPTGILVLIILSCSAVIWLEKMASRVVSPE